MRRASNAYVRIPGLNNQQREDQRLRVGMLTDLRRETKRMLVRRAKVGHDMPCEPLPKTKYKTTAHRDSRIEGMKRAQAPGGATPRTNGN